MAETALPAVASKVFTNCKKCAAERYHIVLAHTNATTAKVECEVCHSKKSFKLPSTKPAKPKKVGGAAAAKKAQAVENRKNAHSKEYGDLLDSADGDAVGYTMKANFSAKQKIKHPKFGVGVIKSSLPEKIEVMFEDQIRTLVHNRV